MSAPGLLPVRARLLLLSMLLAATIDVERAPDVVRATLATDRGAASDTTSVMVRP
jgi:hypothetical protein